MKNKSKYIIVAISIIVGLLHFLIRPEYSGFASVFIHSYLIDILLPFNVYLLLQLALRTKISIRNSRIIAIIVTYIIGVVVELLQYAGVPVFGNTFDLLDLLMYGIGVIFAFVFDLLIIGKIEKS